MLLCLHALDVSDVPPKLGTKRIGRSANCASFLAEHLGLRCAPDVY